MDSRRILVGWLRRFGMIHGFVMMLTWLACALFAPSMPLDVSFLGRMLVFSFCGSLPGMVYISRHDLTEKEWWLRTLLHYLLLNLLLLPLSQWLGLWPGIAGLIAFAVIILVVDVLVHGLSFGLDWILARDVNMILSQERRMEQSHSANRSDA